LGGHSGLEIDKHRANANVLIAEALHQDIPFRMISFSGGAADNAITPASEALFTLSPSHVEALKTRIADFARDVRTRYPGEDNLSIALTPLDKSPDQAASAADSARVVELVASIPQGVQEWSKEFAGLPETSNNIGIVKTENEGVHITTFQRSFDPEKLADLARAIEATATNAGAVSARRSTFPTWPPNPDSELYRKALRAYESLFMMPLKKEVLHDGLESGYVVEKYPEMEIISIGPTLENVHTTSERLYIPSLERISLFLRELMRNP
jgi:dipeptidase D